MLSITYMGHQGWIIESKTTRILVDPLLTDSFDHANHPSVLLYPPRRIDLGSFPPVDAVFFTHEHPDHFNVSSLMCLDRDVPCFISGRASVAAHGLLRELGFPMRLLRSGELVSIGDIEVHPFHSTEITRDEWDVVPLLIRDRAGHGSLATAIDAPETSEFTRFVMARHGRPDLWVSTRIHVDLFPIRADGQQRDGAAATRELAERFSSAFQAGFRNASPPTVLALLEDGVAFAGDLAWMNQHVFPARFEAAAAMVAEKLPDSTVRAPRPGHHFVFEAKRLVGEGTSQPFLAMAELPAWAERGGKPLTGPAPDYAPATGRRKISPNELDALRSELRAFAAHLYGGDLHRALYTRSQSEDVAVGFVLRTGEGSITLRYSPESCSFEEAPPGSLVAGVECWATDLLAALRLDFLAGNITIGRYRKWNREARRLPCDFDLELAFYTHPLRQPERMAVLYRDIIRTSGAEPRHRIRFAGGDD